MNASILKQSAQISTFDQSFSDFYEWYAPSIRRPEKALALYTNHIKPHLAEMSVQHLAQADVVRVLIAIQIKSGDNTTRASLSLLQQVFDFMELGQTIPENPISNLNAKRLRITPVKKVDRVLTMENLQTLIKFVDAPTTEVKPAMKAAIKLQAILVNRINELCLARWEHFDFKEKTWFVPAENTKTGQDHLRPLPDQAVEIILSLKPYTLETGLVLGDLLANNVTGTLSRWQKAGRINFGKPFTIHDLRRTAATLLGESYKVEPHIIKSLLSHADSSAFGNYNFNNYLDERRAALQGYANDVFQTVVLESGEVQNTLEL